MLGVALLLTVLAAPPSSSELPRLVSVDWLAAHLHDPDLVVFQIGDKQSRPTYDVGHIPGSQFVDPWRELSAPRVDGALALEMPSAAVLDSVLEAKGVSGDSRIVVVFADEYYSPAGRTVLALEYAGLGGRVGLLDGGLDAWKAAGHEVTTVVPTPAPGRLTVRIDSSVVVDADYVAHHLQRAGVAIVDARSRNFYDGADTRQGRNGHLPGAGSLYFGSVVGDDGRLKDRAALRALFEAAGVRPGDRVVAYCHIGQQASLVWFAAGLAGYDAALYDGSFQEWARRTDLPVVGSAP
jgi:thiosulfate/3-mercaptopyruvate sulfurtransferase